MSFDEKRCALKEKYVVMRKQKTLLISNTAMKIVYAQSTV